MIRINHVTVAVVRQPYRGICHVTDGENHSVNIQISVLLRGFATDTAVTLKEDVFRYVEPVNTSAGIGVDGLRRAEKAKAQTRLALRMFGCRCCQHGEVSSASLLMS